MPGPTPDTLRVLCSDGVTPVLIDRDSFNELQRRGLDHFHIVTGAGGWRYPRVSSVDLRTGKQLVSRMVIGAWKGDVVGHRNADTFDVRRSNLYLRRKGRLRREAEKRQLEAAVARGQ